MCAITLTVLPTCKHELPTIQYCSDAFDGLDAYKHKCQLGIKTPPPPTCTDSLGWMIFSRLEAPVKCEGCIMWLTINGKQTYGGMLQEQAKTETKKEEDAELAEGSRKKIKLEENNGKGGSGTIKDEESKDDSEKRKKLNDETLDRLNSDLSRRFGTARRG